MNKKAMAQAKKMAAFDVAAETVLADSVRDLDIEIATFGTSKTAVKTYLQEQYKSRLLLRNRVYNTIPIVSEFRQQVKPYALPLFA